MKHAVMKHAKNPPLAKQFLHYINTSEVQARLPELIPYGVLRKDVMHRYAADAYRHLPTHPSNLKTALTVDDRFWVEHGSQLERTFGIYVQLYAAAPAQVATLAQASRPQEGFLASK